jgi:DNA topoisomerase-1
MKGKYGPYVSDGKLNATLPQGSDPGSVTMEEAVALLAARAAKGPTKKGGKKAKAESTAEAGPKAKKTKKAENGEAPNGERKPQGTSKPKRKAKPKAATN